MLLQVLTYAKAQVNCESKTAVQYFSLFLILKRCFIESEYNNSILFQKGNIENDLRMQMSCFESNSFFELLSLDRIELRNFIYQTPQKAGQKVQWFLKGYLEHFEGAINVFL